MRERRLQLRPPDWSALLGVSSEAEWIVDRDRKLESASRYASRLQETIHKLKSREAVYRASPKVLLELPFSGLWYVSLAGFSQKTLSNIKEGPKAFGMTLAPATVVKNLTRLDDSYASAAQRPSRPPSANELQCFCNWVNDEISRAHPPQYRDEERAMLTAALILGGRIIGQGQNSGGEVAVALLKELLVRGLAPRYGLEVLRDGQWRVSEPTLTVESESYFRLGGKMVLEFVSGGNRPDLKITVDDTPLVVAEIKGRKDLSNLWESWMPQVASHMRTWRNEFPDAARLFFGTLINAQMVEGMSIRGTHHIGLRELHEDGSLTSAYNVAKVAARDQAAQASFDDLLRSLAAVLEE